MNSAPKTRIESIDLLRGIVIVIMALDHVRDYFHASNFRFDPNDLTQTTAAIFFTRWITNICAPTFVFLAGTSAFLVGERKSKKELSRFLLKRGLWLMFLEVAVVGFAWTFNPAYYIFRLQVIWALGLCMVILAAVIHLPVKAILVLALVIIFGHNLMDNIHVSGSPAKDFLWGEFHERRRVLMFGHMFTTGYSIPPWFGIMALGYCFGRFYQKGFDPVKRRKYLLGIGVSMLALFIILRNGNFYGDNSPWDLQSSLALSVCSFLNVTKYPPSLLYTLSTLGFALIFLALSEIKPGWIGSRLIRFGRVPMFFYLLHLFLIHGLATVAIALSGRPWTDTILQTMANGKDSPWLTGYGFSLGGTYLVWIAVILILYPLCLSYDRYKQNHKDKWWLSYL